MKVIAQGQIGIKPYDGPIMMKFTDEYMQLQV